MHVESFYEKIICPYEMLDIMQVKVYGAWF